MTDRASAPGNAVEDVVARAQRAFEHRKRTTDIKFMVINYV